MLITTQKLMNFTMGFNLNQAAAGDQIMGEANWI